MLPKLDYLVHGLLIGLKEELGQPKRGSGEPLTTPGNKLADVWNWDFLGVESRLTFLYVFATTTVCRELTKTLQKWIPKTSKFSYLSSMSIFAEVGTNPAVRLLICSSDKKIYQHGTCSQKHSEPRGVSSRKIPNLVKSSFSCGTLSSC